MSQIKSRYKKLCKLAYLSSNCIHEFGFWYFINVALNELETNKLGVFKPEPQYSLDTFSEDEAYKIWLIQHAITDEIRLKMKNKLREYKIRPKISILVSISDKNKKYLNETISSVKQQAYPEWELLFFYPKSLTDEIVVKETSDARIINKPEISQDLAKIIATASGDLVAFTNSGNTLTEDALFKVVEFLNEVSDADLVYFDEDKIDKLSNRVKPFFKPSWSNELFLNLDYISNFYLVSTKILTKIEGFKSEYAEAMHYELLLRLTEATKKIVHIPTITFNVRDIADDVTISNFAQYGKKAVSDALKRRGINAKVDLSIFSYFNGLSKNNSALLSRGTFPQSFRIKYPLQENSKVSIIIPTKDKKNLLKRCISSIEKNTSYKNYEIIIVDNNSGKNETISYLNSIRHTVIKYNFPFNFSKINNFAASHASGDYLLFLNDDTAPIESDWLSEMISIAQQENVGIVGAKLVYSSNLIQHAGLVFLESGAGFHPMQGIDSNSPGYFGFLNVVRNFSAVTGACLLISKKIFEEIGGFDDKFDLYYGDADICLKVIDRGYRVVYTPHAKLLHEGSSSIKEHAKSFFAVENHCEFVKKWPNIKNGDPFYNPNLGWDYRINVSKGL